MNEIILYKFLRIKLVYILNINYILLLEKIEDFTIEFSVNYENNNKIIIIIIMFPQSFATNQDNNISKLIILKIPDQLRNEDDYIFEVVVENNTI